MATQGQTSSRTRTLRTLISLPYHNTTSSIRQNFEKFLTIISRARMGSELIAHEAEEEKKFS